MQRKTFLKHLGAAAATAAVAPWLTACGGGGDAAPAAETTPKPDPIPTTLDATEAAGLQYMREEEKLAHDFYVAMYARWGVNVFNNIAASETSHTQAVLDLLTAFGIADLGANQPSGVFVDTTLQALYDDLMTQGNTSLIEALKAACLIEETDIKDLRDRIALTDEANIASVYNSLLCGSARHLAAFDQQLRTRGESYAATVITQSEWDAIAADSGLLCQ